MTDDILQPFRTELAAHGRARLAARRKAAKESEAIRRLAHMAVGAGMSKSEIARLAQITRPALDTMLREPHRDTSNATQPQ